MFFSEPKRLPDELILEILNKLPLEDAMSVFLTSKEIKDLIEDIWKKFGGNNFGDFIRRLKNLPANYQLSVLEQEYSVEVAENIVDVLNQDLFKRLDKVKELLPEYNIPYEDLGSNIYNHEQTIPLITGLLKRCISPEQMARLNTYHILILLDERGTRALKNGIITPEEAAKIAPNDLTEYLIRSEFKELEADNATPRFKKQF